MLVFYYLQRNNLTDIHRHYRFTEVYIFADTILQTLVIYKHDKFINIIDLQTL